MKNLFLLTAMCFLFGVFRLESSDFNEEQEKLYQKGIFLRNSASTSKDLQKEEFFRKAQECFLPLANQGFVKAIHNYAFCAYELGERESAYRYYTIAAEKGFEASKRNILRMNLVDLLLPNEILVRIASYLKMKDFCNFSEVSKRFYGISNVRSLKKGYDPILLMKNVKFNIPPKQISLETMLCVEDTDLEIHFRDVNHLEQIVKSVPSLSIKKGKYFFVKDEKTRNGEEFLLTNKEKRFQWSHYIHIKSDSYIEMTGKAKLPCSILLPQNAQVTKMDLECKFMKFGDEPSFFIGGRALANSLKNFSLEKAEEKTKLALLDIENRKIERKENPLKFKKFNELCSSGIMLSDREIFVSPFDSLTSDSPIIYISDSKENLLNLY